jgi:monoamine oxidase
LNSNVDVVIVGGGAAGVGAARRLAQSGLSAILLEAGAQLGGRAFTQDIRGHTVDLGCGWFHSGERNAWIRIAEAAGISIDRSTAKWGTQFRDLGFPKAEQLVARKAFGEWMDRLQHAPPLSDCAGEAMVEGNEWNDYIRAIVGFISGARPERLSIADYLAYDEASSDNNWRARSGYGSLVARSFPERIPLRLETPVEELALDRRGVAVRTQAGTISARAAIVTVSTAVLAGDALQLPAGLAPWREAASGLPVGCNEKLFFEIVGDAPFEPETQLLGNPRDVRTASYYIRPLGAATIECFFGGQGARHLFDGGLEAAYDYALGQLSGLFGAEIRRTLRPLAASDWSRMPHIGGAYSYALPERAAARKVLARPFEDRLFFAGEATSAGDFSTAHGAHDSGVRAADEAIAALT